MDKNLQRAMNRCSSATKLLRKGQDFESVTIAKVDLECACAALDLWLEERVMYEPAIYHPSCPICIRGLAHTQLEHDAIVELRKRRTEKT